MNFYASGVVGGVGVGGNRCIHKKLTIHCGGNSAKAVQGLKELREGHLVRGKGQQRKWLESRSV